jgi:rhodanese-related sulfurtransferase
MGFFDFLKGNDINTEIASLEEGTVLLDVREADEFGAGHIPGAVNAPLSALSQFHFPWAKDTPIRVYCLAGTRSRRAVSFLQSQGFTNVKNIGGVTSYKGRLEK